MTITEILKISLEAASIIGLFAGCFIMAGINIAKLLDAWEDGKRSTVSTALLVALTISLAALVPIFWFFTLLLF